MRLTNAYIIDGDIFNGYIDTLRALNGTALENSINSHIANALVEFKKQHLKPALPIVEDSFYNGIASTNAFSNVWELIKSGDFRKELNEFLTKDF